MTFIFFNLIILMFPWGKGLRNFGWYCKGDCDGHYGGGVPLYECGICGPAGEYCGPCATRQNGKCEVGHRLHKG